MSKANNLTDFLSDVATAIRTKKGTTALIDPQDFSSEIASIKTAPTLQSKTVVPGRDSKTVTPDSGYDGLSRVNVTGEQNLTSDNIRKGVTMFGIVGSYGGLSDGVYTRPFNDIY